MSAGEAGFRRQNNVLPCDVADPAPRAVHEDAAAAGERDSAEERGGLDVDGTDAELLHAGKVYLYTRDVGRRQCAQDENGAAGAQWPASSESS